MVSRRDIVGSMIPVAGIAALVLCTWAASEGLITLKTMFGLFGAMCLLSTALLGGMFYKRGLLATQWPGIALGVLIGIWGIYEGFVDCLFVCKW